MKKNKPSQQNSLDSFLSGKSYSTKKESSNNISKPEKKQKIETQPPIQNPEKITKKSQKRENGRRESLITLQLSILNKDDELKTIQFLFWFLSLQPFGF